MRAQKTIRELRERNVVLEHQNKALLGALEALKAGVEDRCELTRRCDIAACNCGSTHPTIIGERVNRARHVIAHALKAGEK